MKIKKGEWLLVAFNAIYVVAFTIYYLSIRNYEFLWYVLVLVIIALVVLVNLRKTNLDYLALWGLSIWGLLHMLGGGLRINGETLYKFRIIEIVDRGGEFFILKTDQLIHLYGFAVAAIVVYQLLAPKFKGEYRSKLVIFLAFIGSMGLGALNEVVEFIALVFLSQTGVGGVYNMGLDLVFNLFGALLGSFIGLFWHKKKIKDSNPKHFKKH